MPTLTAPSTVSFPLQIDQILTLTTNFGTGNVTLSAQKSGDIVYSYNSEQMQDSPVFSPGSQGVVTITHLTGSLTYNVTTSAFPLFENTPRVLFQSAIPFILASGTATNQFTVNSAGLVTALPTLPYPTFSVPCFMYMPSGVTGTAGWYYAQVLSATSAQLYTARYTGGDPRLAVPTVAVTQSTTAGNYSQSTALITCVSGITVPGGSMGPNGQLEIQYTAAFTDNNNGHAWRCQFAGFDVQSAGVGAGSVSLGSMGRVSNRNSQSVNVLERLNSYNALNGGSGSAIGYRTVNTAVDQSVSFAVQLPNATTNAEFASFETFTVMVRYGA